MTVQKNQHETDNDWTEEKNRKKHEADNDWTEKSTPNRQLNLLMILQPRLSVEAKK